MGSGAQGGAKGRAGPGGAGGGKGGAPIARALPAAVEAMVTRWGDGGLIYGEPTADLATAKRRASARVRRAVEMGGVDTRANRRVVLTAWPPESMSAESSRWPSDARMREAASMLTSHMRLVATRDPSDRAHGVYDRDKSMLFSALELRDCEGSVSVPRRYPRHQMTSRGVSFDSAMDELAERAEWLQMQGLGGWSADRLSSITVCEAMMAAQRIAAVERARSGRRVTARAIIERHVEGAGGRETPEQYAMRVLAEHRQAAKHAEKGGGKQ